MLEQTHEQQIQCTIDDCNKQIELADALDRLHRNKDFKKVFTEAFFRDEPSRLTFFLSDPTVDTEEKRDNVYRELHGISQLHGFFRKIEHGAMVARRTKAEHLEELAREGEEV